MFYAVKVLQKKSILKKKEVPKQKFFLSSFSIPHVQPSVTPKDSCSSEGVHEPRILDSSADERLCHLKPREARAGAEGNRCSLGELGKGKDILGVRRKSHSVAGKLEAGLADGFLGTTIGAC